MKIVLFVVGGALLLVGLAVGMLVFLAHMMSDR